jgi:hypothetical protein
MEITDPIKVQIGQWYSFCCEHDLYQLQTLDDVKEAASTLEWSAGAGVWETLEEALAVIAERSGRSLAEVRAGYAEAERSR